MPPSLDKLITLIWINWIRENMEITWKFWKPGFQWHAKLENTFQGVKIVFQYRSFAYCSVLRLLLLKFEKHFPKSCYNKKIFNLCIKLYFFQNKIKNFCPFCTDVSIRFYAVCTLSEGAARNTEIMKSWCEK